MNFIVIIPARYGSTRLPGKPLVDILGQPMITRTVAAARASGAARVIVATDHPMVAEVVSASGTEVCTTAVHHASGTDRLAEVVAHYQMADEQIVVNLQGDEPLTPPEIITQVADNLAAQCSVNIATLSTPIQQSRELFDPHIVKVVTDSTGCALYFSRAPLPWDRQRFGNIYLPTEIISPSRNSVDHRGDNTQLKHEQATNLCLDKMNTVYQRHIGLYAYRAGFIRRYHQWAPTVLEQIEMLEQLRVLWYGETIHVAQALRPTPIGVDTPEDLTRICTFLAASLKANGQPSL